MNEVLGNTQYATDLWMDTTTGDKCMKYDTEVEQINTLKSYTKLFCV